MFRLARENDIDDISNLYEKVHAAQERGDFIIGWEKGVYPVRQTVIDALKREDIYVQEDNGHIVATAILNHVQVPVYDEIDWEFKADPDKVFVIHTLAVDPDFGKMGYGRKFVKFYEELAREKNCEVLRLDTMSINALARKLYKSLGFREAGIGACEFNGIPGVKLVCIEKSLI